MNRIKEIETRLFEIRTEQLKISRHGNNLWEEKLNLANEYKELTGNEII